MKKVKYYLILLIIAGISVFFILEYINAISLKDDVYKEYTSIDKLKSNINFDFEVPIVLQNELSNSTFKIFGNELVIIENNKFEFRVANKIQEWADVLGIDEPSNESYLYEVKNDSIKKLRYRTGYDTKYCVCNWYTDDLMYGIKFNLELSLEEILDGLGITVKDLTEINLDNENNSLNSNSYDFKSYTTNSKNISILIPDIQSRLDVITSDSSIIFNMSNRTILYITSNTDEELDSSFDIYESDNYKLGIVINNEFSEDSTQYRDLEIIKDNIDRIVNTIEVN